MSGAVEHPGRLFWPHRGAVINAVGIVDDGHQLFVRLRTMGTPAKKTKPRLSARPDHRPAGRPPPSPPAVVPPRDRSPSRSRPCNPASENDVPTRRTGPP